MPKQDVSIARHFAGPPGPRVERTEARPLGDALVIALGAVACGADAWEIARHIREGGGGYPLAVKGDRPALRDAVYAAFGRARGADSAGVTHDGHEAAADGHGRHEERSTTVLYDPPAYRRSGRTWRRSCWSGGGRW